MEVFLSYVVAQGAGVAELALLALLHVLAQLVQVIYFVRVPPPVLVAVVIGAR